MSSSSSPSQQLHQEEQIEQQDHKPRHRKEKTSITVESEYDSSPNQEHEEDHHSQAGSNILDYFKPAKKQPELQRSASESSTNTDTSTESQSRTKNKNKMADTEQQQHQIGLQDDTQSQGDQGDIKPGEAMEKKMGEERAELGEGPEASDEELDKIEARIVEIIDGALKGIKPWLGMMVERCEEAEQKKKKSEDFSEKEFVESMKPIIRQASETLHKALDEINALDPDKKAQRRAQRNAEDNKASPRQRKIADGLQELTTNVQKAIEDCKKKISDMPTAKSELDQLFGMLSEPLFQILSAVGLLVYGVLNLLGQILDGLGLGKLIKALGWKLQIVRSDK